MKYKEYMEFKEYKTIVLHAENAQWLSSYIQTFVLYYLYSLYSFELLKNKVLWEN